VIIGMDFGTTNSGMSVYDGERLRLIPLDPANRSATVARSALYITNDRSVYIGRQATDVYYQQNLNRPSKYEKIWVGEIEQTFAELPTFIRDVYIDKDIYSPGRLFLSFKMGLSSPNYLGTIVGSQYFFLEDIIATYLYIAKQRAESYLETELDTIVLGRPVRYSDDPDANEFAKERMIQSAFSAGYKTVYLQYEPIAAAFYYETTIQREQNVLIFDFGGGTLDLSIVQVGNPKTRQVIANGGIPIAGDVFDQRIVREKYPRHFGEGGTYISGNTELPVPPAFYDSFSDWQTMLTLQMPQSMERLRQITQTSKQRHKMNALMSLITGQYGLKMFDVAEEAKRNLSERLSARIDMQGDGFKVFDLLTRSEFERIIRADVQAIDERLDEVLKLAGMQAKDIDAVIRTGGSSQIPVFIRMLENRFGAEKVLEIDAFGSVTSGLGVIGHRLERGEIEMQAYHVDTYTGSRHIREARRRHVPNVDLDLLKRVIDVQESGGLVTSSDTVLLMRDAGQKIEALHCENLEEASLAEVAEDSFFYALPASSKLVLMTSFYTAYVKQVGDLADLRLGNLHMEELEGFRKDDFSTEYISNLAAWEQLEETDFIMLISSLGYTQKFFSQRLLEKIDRPVPYKMERKRGYPAFLVGAKAEQDFLAISHAGRIARISSEQLPLRENRLLNLSMKGQVIGALAANHDDEIVIATQNGTGKRISLKTIPQVSEMNSTGEKLVQRANLVSALLYHPEQSLWAATNQRLLPIEQDALPLDSDNNNDYSLAKLKKGEKILSLFYSN
jgi:hypothetical chaperone protein